MKVLVSGSESPELGKKARYVGGNSTRASPLRNSQSVGSEGLNNLLSFIHLFIFHFLVDTNVNHPRACSWGL